MKKYISTVLYENIIKETVSNSKTRTQKCEEKMNRMHIARNKEKTLQNAVQTKTRHQMLCGIRVFGQIVTRRAMCRVGS